MKMVAYSTIIEEYNKIKDKRNNIFSIGIKNNFIKYCGDQKNAQKSLAV